MQLQKSKVIPKYAPCLVPSSYNQVKEKELISEGFNVVIYANHMLKQLQQWKKLLLIS